MTELISRLDYDTHEVPLGILREAPEIEADLQLAEQLARSLEVWDQWRDAFAYWRMHAQVWREYRASRSDSYADFLQARGISFDSSDERPGPRLTV